MGAGLAAQTAAIVPGLRSEYRRALRNHELGIGKPYLSKKRQVILFATKEHWHAPSKLVYIREGMQGFASLLRAETVSSVAIPALGCGLGQLRVADVAPIIFDTLQQFPEIRFVLYGFHSL